jgi:hypothetical protein
MSFSALSHYDSHNQDKTGYNHLAACHVSGRVGALSRRGSARRLSRSEATTTDAPRPVHHRVILSNFTPSERNSENWATQCFNPLSGAASGRIAAVVSSLSQDTR